MKKIDSYSDYTDKKHKEELEKLKRSMVKNSEDKFVPGDKKYTFNEITRKMDEVTPDEVEDSLKELDIQEFVHKDKKESK